MAFLRLSEQRLVDISKPALPPAALPPPLAGSTLEAMYLAPNNSKTPMGSRVVYGSEDLGVIPPMILDQRMPAWIPPHPVLAYRMFRGTLEVIVNEDGAVESRTMSEPAYPSYDRELLNTAQGWKFSPAIKDGRPVKFERSLQSRLVEV